MALVSAKDGVARLESLAGGLSFVSESDRPVRVVQFGPLPQLDETALRRALGKPEHTPVTRHALGDLFARTVTDQPWHGAADRLTVQRYRALLDFLSSALDAPRVYRVGTIEVDAYALGKTNDGQWLGVATTLIET